MSRAVAAAKAIGHDIEELVAGEVDSLQLAMDIDAHHDATATGLLCPSTVDASVPVVWAGVPLVETGTQVEIKACVRETGSGRSGRWLIKGRNDGQHAALLDEGAMYALAVYDETPGGEKVLVAVAIIPASLLDEHLRASWWSVDRRESTIAKLGWPHLLGGVVRGEADGE